MINYEYLFVNTLLSNPVANQPVAIVVHDNRELGVVLGGMLVEQGYFPRVFEEGEDVIDKWNRRPDLFEGATSLFIHKDLGDRRGSKTASDVVSHIRQWPDGQKLRTVAVSGEFGVEGVSDEARERLQADAGYDPGVGRRLLPDWVVEFIALGQVGEEEARFRGRKVLLSRSDVVERVRWLENFGGNRERK